MKTISADELKKRLSQDAELALVDVREFGRYGEGRPFFAVNMPYSRLELEAVRLIPRRDTPVVLFDEGEGVAERAGVRLAALGYADLSVLEGGVQAWKDAGYTLFRGVNVPSKTYGELVEEARHTPRVTVDEFRAMRERGDPILLVDGRGEDEHHSFTIPGSSSCPNAELGLRLPRAVRPEQTVVVHCAGRTRSIIGAETLRAMGLPNRVVALENGTQGWELAGHEREYGSDRVLAPNAGPETRAAAAELAQAFCRRLKIPRIEAGALQKLQSDPTRTLYLLDVRSREEFEQATAPGAAHAPGGQLIQATDHWLAVRGARVVVWDDAEIRAAFAAYWLRGMGWDAAVLVGPVETRPPAAPLQSIEATEEINAPEVAQVLADGFRVIDMRSSAAYRGGHVDGAVWCIRPNISALPGVTGGRFVVVGDDPAAAALAAQELTEAGAAEVKTHTGGAADWEKAGLHVAATPGLPSDAERIDHLFFVAKRHSGDLDHAREYLAWEQQLISQLDDQELGAYRLDRLTE